MKNKFILVFAFIIFCAKQDKEYQYNRVIVGGPCEIKFYCNNEIQAKKILQEIDDKLKETDSLLNYFSPKSLVSEINTQHRAYLTSEIKELFLLSDSISRLTNGLFDISIAPLLELWGFYSGKERVPTKQEIEQTKKLVDYRKIKIKGDTIIIPENMKIDLGGVAQGFAADQIVKICKKYGIKSAIINIAGEVYGLGMSSKKKSWIVGIKNPRGEGIIEKVELNDNALSTSGDYEKFFVINNIRYAHIIDPRTGYPASAFASVTIFAKNTAFADAIATAVSVMGAHQGKKFLDSLRIKGIIYYEKDNRLERLESR